MSLHPEQADEHPRTHSTMSCSLYYRCISQYQEVIEGHAQSFVGLNLPPQSFQPQSAACNVFPCHCWTWLKTLMMWYFVAAHFVGNMLGWMAFFPVVTSSWKHWYLMVSRWSLCFPFSTMFMTFSSAEMTWSFDDFILLDTSACSRKVLFTFTSFNPAAFPITNNLDVNYCITPPGRQMLLDFVPYQINSRAPDGCSFLWFGSEVDIVRVSISKMNQENKRVSVITHQLYCFTGVWDFHCHWNMLFIWQPHVAFQEGLGTIACYLC